MNTFHEILRQGLTGEWPLMLILIRVTERRRQTIDPVLTVLTYTMFSVSKYVDTVNFTGGQHRIGPHFCFLFTDGEDFS